jgi:hypothetical protein
MNDRGRKQWLLPSERASFRAPAREQRFRREHDEESEALR